MTARSCDAPSAIIVVLRRLIDAHHRNGRHLSSFRMVIRSGEVAAASAQIRRLRPTVFDFIRLYYVLEVGIRSGYPLPAKITTNRGQPNDCRALGVR